MNFGQEVSIAEIDSLSAKQIHCKLISPGGLLPPISLQCFVVFLFCLKAASA